MTSHPIRLTLTLALVALASLAATPVDAQALRTDPRASSPSSPKSGSIPRTPWGDPDLQGTYSNSNESGIPMERPAELAGKKLQDVSPAELARLGKERNERAEVRALNIGATEENPTGAGPVWDPLESTCRHASLSIL